MAKIITVIIIMLLAMGASFFTFVLMFGANSPGGNGGGGALAGMVFGVLFLVVMAISALIWYNGIMFFATQHDGYYQCVINPLRISFPK